MGPDPSSSQQDCPYIGVKVVGYHRFFKHIFVFLSYTLFFSLLYAKSAFESQEWFVALVIYSLGVYWCYTFVFKRKMHILTSQVDLDPEEKKHSVPRLFFLLLGLGLSISVLYGL